MLVGSALFLVFGLLGRLGIAKFVSVQVWGVFNLGLSLSGLVSLVALLGLHQAMARTLSFESDPGVRRALVRRTLLITCADALAVSGATFLFAPELAALFGSGSVGLLTETLQLFSVLVGVTILTSFLAALFQGFEDAFPNSLFNQILAPGLFVVFLAGVVLLHLDYVAVLIAYVLSSGLALGGLSLYAWRRIPRYLPPASSAGRVAFPQGFWSLATGLWGVNALAYVTTFADTLILGIFWPASVVGLYSAATTLARLFLLVNGALAFIYLPVSARLTREGDRRGLQVTFASSARWTVALTLPLLLVFLFLPGPTLNELFGRAYGGAATPLLLLSSSAFLSVALGPVNSCLAGLGRSRSLLYNAISSGGCNLLLSFALIPRYAALGAAVAWATSRLLYLSLGAFTLYSKHGILSFGRILLYPTLLTLGVGGSALAGLSLLHPVGWWIFPAALLVFGVFLGSVLLTRTLTLGDLTLLELLEKARGREFKGLRPRLERFLWKGATPPDPGSPPTPL
jgi:O-antigen/teichoic acid export membrane protein